MRELHLRTSSVDQTRAVAAVLAKALRSGDVLALTGELGAGKTSFVQGAAAALGVRERVTSPSFVLRREYEGRLPIAHVDVYRLDSLSDVLEIGFEEVIGRRHVAFIEWADAIYAYAPESLYAGLREALRRYRGPRALPPVQVATERGMACGVGVCLGCMVETTSGLKTVCRDGPVFPLEQLVLE